MKTRIPLVTILSLFLFSRPAQSAPEPGCAPYEKYKCPGGSGYEIHLTFDDGPVSGPTDQVLDTLKKNGVRATFFIMGEKVDPANPHYSPRNIELVKRAVSEGHQIGSHSYRHIMHSELSAAQLREIVDKAKRAGRAEIGPYLSPLFRLPWGDGWYNEKRIPEKSRLIMKTLADAGFTHVGWDVVSWDWDASRQRSPGILDITMQRLCSQKGGVVLMHDIQLNTARHLDEWIHAMRCHGYVFAPLDHFIKYRTEATGSGGSCTPSADGLSAFITDCQKLIDRAGERTPSR